MDVWSLIMFHFWGLNHYNFVNKNWMPWRIFLIWRIFCCFFQLFAGFWGLPLVECLYLHKRSNFAKSVKGIWGAVKGFLLKKLTKTLLWKLGKNMQKNSNFCQLNYTIRGEDYIKNLTKVEKPYKSCKNSWKKNINSAFVWFFIRFYSNNPSTVWKSLQIHILCVFYMVLCMYFWIIILSSWWNFITSN